MLLRSFLLCSLLALSACSDDTTGPGGGSTSVSSRAIDLGSVSSNGILFAPKSSSAFDSIHRTGVVTIEAWIDISGFGRALATFCANKADETEAGFYFGIESRDGIENRRLRLNITDENGNTVVDAQGTPGSVDFGSWQHIVVVSDGTEVRFSIDGVEEIVTPTFANLGSTASAARNLSVGSMITVAGPANRFRGMLDELRIWSEARTPTQLVDFGDAPLPASVLGAASAPLLGYWPMDTFESLTDPSNGTNDLRDFSGSGAHLDTPSETRLVVSEAFATGTEE